MMHDEQRTTQVLIAGAGPAGLTAAIALGRQGIDTLVVDRKRELSSLPRATVISTRSMELLRSWGLEQDILAGAVDVAWQMWRCESLALASAGSPVPVGLPTREQSAVVSPAAPECVPQDHTERVLLDHARSLGSVRVELGTEVAGAESDDEGACVVLRDAAGGASRVVGARYLIAADGAHSAVRDALGIAVHGPGRFMDAASVLFRAPLWDVVGAHRYGIYDIGHPEAPGALLPAGRGDRWVYGVRWEPGTRKLEEFTEQQFAGLLRLATGVADLQPRIERIGGFSFAAQLAERFRSGSSFLVGDAAHRVSPRGGTGMNTAIHDGFDLGWKLAWVLRGWAGPELLDSYERERRPVAEHNLARSADPNGSVRDVGRELRADLGDRVAHVWVPAPAGRVSTLDLLGDGLTLFTGPQSGRWESGAASAPGSLPVAVRRLDAITARALGIRIGGALLARPDGAPTGWWSTSADAVPALHAAVRSIGALAARTAQAELAVA
jgi:2-polyprenyl-6-methoxyphenol hydroxylase-like FAD-dependent oxidoreductase